MRLSPLFPSFGVSSQAWVGERTNIGEEGNKHGMTRYIEPQNVQPMSKPGTNFTLYCEGMLPTITTPLLRGGTFSFFLGGRRFHPVPARYHSKVFKNLLPQFGHQIQPLGGAIPKITSLWPSALGSLFWECPTLGLYPAHNVGPGNSTGMQIEI
jgi:hypothetical protein